MLLLTVKVSESVNIGRLGASGGAVDDVLEAVGVSEEVSVLNLVVLVSVDESNSVDRGLIDLETESVKDLSEDLGADLEGAERVSILEEGLGIESVLSDDFTELIDDTLDDIVVLSLSISSTVHGLGADITDYNIDVLLKSLSGEDFVNTIRELSPLYVVTFLGGLESLAEEGKLTLRDLALGHSETNSELSGSDVT